jgi:hypothetical protein
MPRIRSNADGTHERLACLENIPRVVEGVTGERFYSLKNKPIVVNVNRGTVDSNRKHGWERPPISFRLGRNGGPVYANEIRITGTTTFVYRPDAPLPCGARVWAEVDGTVEVLR